MRRLNLKNKTFNHLTVVDLARVENGNRKRVYWKCICECGNTTIVRADQLTSGRTTSCGCYNKSVSRTMIVEMNMTHGQSNSRFYSIWRAMKVRCSNENHIAYKNYGGRGIKVCDRWFTSFENFEADMFESYEQHVKEFSEKQTSIDRVNPNGNYEPRNCRWATNLEQSKNKRNSKPQKSKGETA